MSSVRDTFLDFFKNEDIRIFLKEMIRPINHLIYNEIYPYVWFICFYSVFLFFITLANLIILIWIRNTIRGMSLCVREMNKYGCHPHDVAMMSSESKYNDILRV
jgi:hypothetical protein